MDLSPAYLLAILEVIWVNILLSGDNAVVIALACKSLPDNQRRIGILLGSAAAIVLRIIFAFMVTWLMSVPFLQAAGGALLFWIAIGLARGNGGAHNVKAHETLWYAVRTIALADAVMSLDNVVAIAAISRGDHWLFIIGLILSIPLIVGGATLISNLLDKLPMLVWAGAALLGWIAGEMIAKDPALVDIGLPVGELPHYGAAFAGAMLVVLVGYWLKRRE
ncbi:MAG: TerC family protein, partial [Methylocella sp.]